MSLIKKLVAIAMVIFLLFYTGVIIASLFSGNKTENGNVLLKMEEIAEHNSIQSCWLLINGKVYDVTNFTQAHPGGSEEILRYCGQEATTAFITQGGQGEHSQQAIDMLSGYYIGEFDDK